METYAKNYYTYKIVTLFFAIIFIIAPIYGFIHPEDLPIRVGKKIFEPNIPNLIILIAIGILAIFLFTWMVLKFFRIKMDESGITIIKLRKKITYTWEEIKFIKEVNWLWKGTIFKVKLKNENTFYFLSDKPTKMLSKEMFPMRFETKMGEFIKSKKQEFKI